MTNDPVTITLPLPSSKLHAHNKGSWHSKRKPTADYRLAARLAAERVLGKRRPNYTGAALLIRFFWKNRAARDALNAVQGLKPAIDGCVDAGVILDDRWTILQRTVIENAIDATHPRVELVFYPIEPLSTPGPRGREKNQG